MAVVSDLSLEQLRLLLKRGELRIKVGPYTYAIQSSLDLIVESLQTLYGDYPLADINGFADFHVGVRPANFLQYLRRRVDFYIDNGQPFNRIKNAHAFAFLEWGMNWCVARFANEHLKLHAAVVEKNNNALILPGLPGAGKSTLCAALALSGWRVLSDEHTLIKQGSSEIVPVCRPVGLKNQSIDIIKSRYPESVFGAVAEETHKGTVSHMKADMAAGSHDTTPVPARLMVFPEYSANSDLELLPRGKADCFMFAALHSFNYSLLGVDGFNTMSMCLDAVDCYSLNYAHLDQAIDVINQLEKELY
ncbi:MAG: HprK-related kinase A [Porticoccaceae bacterium]